MVDTGYSDDTMVDIGYSDDTRFDIRVFPKNCGWVRFLVVCFLYKTNPSPPKNICFGKRGPRCHFYPMVSWVGLALGWVSCGFIIIFRCFLTQHNLVNHKHPIGYSSDTMVDTMVDTGYSDDTMVDIGYSGDAMVGQKCFYYLWSAPPIVATAVRQTISSILGSIECY